MTHNLLARVCFSDQFNDFIPMLVSQIGEVRLKIGGHFMNMVQMFLDQYLVFCFVFAVVALKQGNRQVLQNVA